jgi:hypothetical protein
LKLVTAAAVDSAAPCSLLAEKIEAMATIMAERPLPQNRATLHLMYESAER